MPLHNGTLHNGGRRVTAGQLPATQTNDNAPAGALGEVISSTVTSGSAVSLTSGAAKTITSIALTAGDWDIDAVICFLPNASTTMSSLSGGINTTTDTYPTAPAGGVVSLNLTFTTGVGQYLPLGTVRASLTGATTYYLVGLGVFGVSTLGGYGVLKARRAR